MVPEQQFVLLVVWPKIRLSPPSLETFTFKLDSLFVLLQVGAPSVNTASAHGCRMGCRSHYRATHKGTEQRKQYCCSRLASQSTRNLQHYTLS